MRDPGVPIRAGARKARIRIQTDLLPKIVDFWN